VAALAGLTDRQVQDVIAGLKADEGFAKQITAVGVTAGQLVRQDLSETISLMAPQSPPLRKRFSRVPGNGAAHQWYRLTAQQYLGNRYIGGTAPPAAFFARGLLPVSVMPTYQIVSAPYKNVGELITIPFQTQDEGRSFVDIRAHQKKIRTLMVMQAEEWCILNGNATAAAVEFDGLGVQVTQQIPLGTGNLALFFDIQKACQRTAEYGGQSRCVVYPYRAHSYMCGAILSVLARWYGPGAQGVLAGARGGFSVSQWDFGYGVIDLIPERYLESDSYGWPVYVLDDMSPDTEDNGNVISMVDLHSLDMIELGLLASAWRDLVFETTVLKITCPDFQWRITNVTTAFLEQWENATVTA
jgi:hypothetical protein